mgnify:CR=1 FL=1|tara:strand:+ start:171 stop:464 length:294 start_codon:yes stop_codon:yes gene_type:complete
MNSIEIERDCIKTGDGGFVSIEAEVYFDYEYTPAQTSGRMEDAVPASEELDVTDASGEAIVIDSSGVEISTKKIKTLNDLLAYMDIGDIEEDILDSM